MIKRRAKIESDFTYRDRLRRLFLLIVPNSLSVNFLRRRLSNNDEHCSLEATKFLLDANNLYPTKFYFLLPKFLRFIFFLGAKDIRSDFINQFIFALQTTRTDPKRRKEMCNDMLAHTISLRSNSASSSSWKLTSLALSSFGFIRAGRIARKNCLDTSIEKVASGQASIRTIHLAVSGLLESRRFEEAQQIISNPISDLLSDARLPVYLNYLKLISPYSRLSNVSSPLSSHPEDRRYVNLVASKTIALVAPGDVHPSHGCDIDQHEIVARVKYIGNARSPILLRGGTRCDINFLLDQFIETIIIDRKIDPKAHSYLNEILLLITRKALFDVENLPVTLPLTNLAPTFLTTATSGTMAIFDLLCKSPTKLKLFGFNFYTERQQYNFEVLKFYNTKTFIRENGLRKNEFNYGRNQRGSSVIASARANHDYLSDFLLVKNLYELSGLIDGTPEVLEILNLTADEYDARLEAMLGDW